MRNIVVAELQAHSELYADGASVAYTHLGIDTYAGYCDSMACEGTWGDEIGLQAAATALVVEIRVYIGDGKVAHLLVVHPARAQPTRTLSVVHDGEAHFNSTQPIRESFPRDSG